MFYKYDTSNLYIVYKNRLVDQLSVSAVHDIFATVMYSFTYGPCLLLLLEQALPVELFK